MIKKDWYELEDFYGKQITLLCIHRDGIKFIYEGKTYDTNDGQSIVEVEDEA